jgi:hypothetical protein
MKQLLVLLVLLFVSPILAAAQGEERDLRTLLQDSSYVFNRFEEINNGVGANIDGWNEPESLKTTQKSVYSGVLRGVRDEKHKLNALILAKDVPASDLFDLYSELAYVDGVLKDESSSFETFGDHNIAVELVQLDAKMGMLAENIRVVLEFKIMRLENQLEDCSTKTPVPEVKRK